MARTFARGRRMEKEWQGIPGIVLDFTTGATLSGGRIAVVSSLTVLRMIGHYVLGPTGGGTFAADDAATVTLGIGVISSDAFDLGATAFPDPGGEPDYPWLYWDAMPFYTGSTGADPASMGASYRRQFDVRSMRKMKPGQSLVAIADYGDLQGVPPLTLVLGQTRVLLGNA